MNSIGLFNISQHRSPPSPGRSTPTLSAGFDSFIENEDAQDRTHGFSDLGMFGKASAVPYDGDTSIAGYAVPKADAEPSKDQAAKQAPNRLQPAAMATLLSSLVSNFRSPQPAVGGEPYRDQTGPVEPVCAPDAATQTEAARSDPDPAPAHAVRTRTSPSRIIRPSSSPIALHIADGDGGLQIIARLSHLAPDDRDEVRERLEKAVAELGHAPGQIILNGSPTPTATHQAIGGHHGARTR